MEFIETAAFTKQVASLLDEESYRLLQNLLIASPHIGKVIPRSGGLRKIRWSSSTKGKRGGLRAIYYWQVNEEIIVMLFLYSKSEQEDLTPSQLKLLKHMVEEWQ